MKKQTMAGLFLDHLRARWRLRWAEARHDGAQGSVEHLRQQLADAEAREKVTAAALTAAQGAASLASDKITWYRVRCGMGLR